LGDVDRPLVVLLLPGRLETLDLREPVEELLRSSSVVAVEPGRIAYGGLLRLPAPMAYRMTMRLARRLKLPGFARAVVLFDPRQLPFAHAIVERHPGAELWYGGGDDVPAGPRDRVLHERAVARAALTFAPSVQENEHLRRRMAAIGVPR
jgi:hypothetical protein